MSHLKFKKCQNVSVMSRFSGRDSVEYTPMASPRKPQRVCACVLCIIHYIALGKTTLRDKTGVISHSLMNGIVGFKRGRWVAGVSLH